MTWHSEEVVGVDAAINAIDRLLPQLNPFQYVVILSEQITFTLCQRPQFCILVCGAITHGKIEELFGLAQRRGLLTSESTASPGRTKGFAFYSPNENSNVRENCCQFLRIFCGDSSKLAIHGVNAKLNSFGFEENGEK